MRMWKAFVSKKEAQEFFKNCETAFAISWEKSETEKRAKSPIWIRDCRKYFGLADKYKYVVIYNA